MSEQKKKLRSPLEVLCIILFALALTLCLVLFAYRMLRPETFSRIWAELFIHAEAIEGGLNDSDVEVEGAAEHPVSIKSSMDSGSVATSLSELQNTVEQINEKGMKSVFEAEGAYIVDSSGNVIFSKNEHEALYPASMTKLLTAIVVAEHVDDLSEVVTIGELTGCYESGSMLLYIDEGDQMSYIDLLHAMLMVSYNDTATALALAVGGTLEDFADMMNETAEEIGCVDSHFVTPHGLFDEEHYSSAYDMTLILQKAMSIDVIADILMTKEYSCQYTGLSGTVYDLTFTNSNYFLNDVYSVPGFTYLGGKTGYIQKARSCIATCFEKDGITYYSTVMKALDASYMTAFLYDYTMVPYSLPALLSTEPVMKEWQLEYEADE